MYLLFGPDDILPLDKIVFNTEAHAFPTINASKKRFKTGWERIPRDEQGNLNPGAAKEEEKDGSGKPLHKGAGTT